MAAIAPIIGSALLCHWLHSESTKTDAIAEVYVTQRLYLLSKFNIQIDREIHLFE